MPYKIKRISSEKLGTHYGLFIDSTLIHYEFSRSAAENVLKAMDSGQPLYDVLFEQINKFCSLKFHEELEKANKEIEQLKLELESSKRKALKPKKTEHTTLPAIKSELEKEASKLKSQDLDQFSIIELAKRHSLSQVEIEELSTLLKDMKSKNFVYSNELSKYIKHYNLGSKYPNISGIVKMQNSSDTWDFDGGFPRNIYRIICQELSLVDQGTSAKAIDFLSYKQLGA